MDVPQLYRKMIKATKAVFLLVEIEQAAIIPQSISNIK